MIRESRFFLGPDAPAHLFLGQIEQESRCNEGVTAFDGGMGLGQFMPATAEDIQKREAALRELSLSPEPYDPAWAIRAIVLYDKWLYNRTDCDGWYFSFRAYNGGLGAINREIGRAGSCNEKAVEGQCKRRKTPVLDMCRVNIAYPRQIFLKAEKYR